MHKLVYLCGPMRGRYLLGFPEFDRYSIRLRKAGWAVVSPADLDRAAGISPDECGSEFSTGMLKECILRDVVALAECDAIAVIPGWEKSKGVRVEMALALFLGIEILNADTMEALEPTLIRSALPWLR